MTGVTGPSGGAGSPGPSRQVGGAGPGGATGGRAGDLPPEAYGAALAGLPAMGPARLAELLGRWPAPEAWARVISGLQRSGVDWSALDRGLAEIAQLAGTWSRIARGTDVAGGWRAYEEAGVAVHLLGRPGYPSVLAADHEAPAVLFALGRPGVLACRRVAIVGTRRCTRYGHDVARDLGHDLAASGVGVVSGLALGVDGAAHAGALAAGAAAAPPIAVVGSGLDVVYPRRHAHLWSRLVEVGLVLSEAPLGAAPEPWRFPVRNRVIAALAEVVVVVESPARGGSIYTVAGAATRGRPVMAVPGSVRSSRSDLPNTLLVEGCAPVRDATDVLVALGLSTPPPAVAPDRRPPPDASGRAVLDAIGWEPATLEDVVARTGLGPAAASLAVARLEIDGWVEGRGGWWDQVPPPSAGR